MVLILILAILIGYVLRSTATLNDDLVLEEDREHYYAVVLDIEKNLSNTEIREGIIVASDFNQSFVDFFELNTKSEYDVAHTFQKIWYTEPDGIIIYLRNNQLVNEYVKESVLRGIEVVLVGQDDPASTRSAYIGTNKWELGQTTASVTKEFHDFNKDLIFVLRDQVTPFDSAAESNFINGFMVGMNSLDIVVDPYFYNSDEKSIETLTQEIFTNHEEGTIIITDPEDSLKAVKVLIDFNKMRNFEVISKGDLDAILEYVDRSTIYATIDVDYYQLGVDACNMMYSLLTDGNLSTFQNVEIEVIRGEDIE
jgi:ABC-type sugar transport system substrate-binding protein